MNSTRFPLAAMALAAAVLGSQARATTDDDLFRPFSRISGSEQLTAVSSHVFNGYVRDRNPDGSYRAETYAFGNGGIVSSLASGVDGMAISGFGRAGTLFTADPTIDSMKFETLARTISRPLAEQNYVPTGGPNETQLLIMVRWGRSAGSYQSADGNFKDYIDARNAQLMGFDADRFVRERTDVSTAFLGRSIRSQIIDQVHSSDIAALQADRYYVILQAFDFQAAWKHKSIKLLWESRFSISERAHDFEKELPTMAHTASKYFGMETGGLIRARIPEGQVDIGEVKLLGNVPDR